MKSKITILSMTMLALMLSACGGNSSSISSASSASTTSSPVTTSSTTITSISSSSSSSSKTSSTTSTTSEATNPKEGEQKIMTLCNGNYQLSADGVIATSSNTIGLAKGSTLVKGSLSLYVTPTVACDTGMIFCVNRKNKATFWETDVSYYFYFVSIVGTAYLGKVNNGTWTELKQMSIPNFNRNNTYKLGVSLDNEGDTTIINCFLDDKEQYSYKDKNKLTGQEIGVRLGGSSSKTSYLYRSESYTPIERKVVGDFYVANGAFNYSKTTDSYTSMSSNSLIYQEKGSQYLEIEVTMEQKGILGCNGLIFNLNADGNESFWESNISYYFFFIDEGGYARLARVNYGEWTDMSTSTAPVAGWSTVSNHVLKVVKDSETINCSVDNNLLISTSDGDLLEGEYIGLRSGVYGTKFKDFSWKEHVGPTYEDTTTFDVISGKVVTANEVKFISKEYMNLALKKESTFSTGTISLDLCVNSTGFSGVVFKASEDGSSYYLFGIENNYVRLSKMVNGNYVPLSDNKYVTAGHQKHSKETMEISIDNDNTIRCYLRGICYVVHNDSEMLSGNRYGFFSSQPSSYFNNLSITSDIKHDQHKTLVFGHSYMELWANYKTDLNKFEDVYNIGIGGSICNQWFLLEKEILDYNPETIIVMLGTNDVLAYDGDVIATNVSNLLTGLKAKSSTITECALISCNRCPAREDYTSRISSMNAGFKQICKDNAWIKYADIDNAFLKNGVPDPSCFTDGLHPTANSYLTIRDAVNTALGK